MSRKQITPKQKREVVDRFNAAIVLGRPREQVLRRIAKHYRKSKRQIERYIAEDRKKSALLKRGRELHLNDVREEVRELRSFLTNPDLHELPDQREPLTINGVDWRLDPIMWFRLCAPDLKNKDAWGPTFGMLLEHIEGSQFLKDYDSLLQAVNSLEQDYKRAAVRLDVESQASWLDIQIKKAERGKISPPLPLRHPGVSDVSMERSPPYEHNLCEKMVWKFHEVMQDPPLEMRLLDLEKQLKKLSLDLDPHEINTYIENGHCWACVPR